MMKQWGTLVIMALSMFIIVIDTTIMNVSISALVEDLDTTVVGVQSAISIYALVMAAFILIASKLSNMYGKKKMFVLGLIVYGIGTLTASFSTTIGMLIVGWSIIEGLGGAMMLPNINTILREKYEGKARATAYGVVGAVAAVGAALGPIIGGLFTTYLSWRWAFRMEVAVVIIVLFMVGYLAKDVLPDKRPKFDWVGSVLSVFGWSSIVLGVISAQKFGFWLAEEPFFIGGREISPFGLSIAPVLVMLGVLSIMGLFKWERKLENEGNEGLFGPSLFKNEGIRSGFLTRTTHTFMMAAFLYLIPLMLQLSFGYNAIETGLALLPFSLGVLVAALLGARMSSKHYANRIIQWGFLICTGGLGMIAASITTEASASELVLGGIFGIGAGLIASQIINLILSSVEEKDSNETAGLTSTFEQLGNAMGVALIGAMMLTTLSAGINSDITESTILASEDKAPLIEYVDSSIQLMSNTDIETGLEASNATAEESAELFKIYDESRTNAFKSGVGLLVFVSLLGLMLSFGLPKRKLVTTDTDHMEVTSG